MLCAGSRPSHQRHRSEPFLSTAGSASPKRPSDSGAAGVGQGGELVGNSRRSTVQGQRMTKESVRQWQMSRTQSVAHTLALMDRDGLFKVLNERGRSTTVGGNVEPAVTTIRSVTRSRSMPQHGSGRYTAGQDAGIPSTQGSPESCKVGVHAEAPGSASTPSKDQPARQPQRLLHGSVARAAATPSAKQQVDNTKGQDAAAYERTTRSANGKAAVDGGQLCERAPVKVKDDAGSTFVEVPRKSSGRQISETASISGRAYARAPSCDAPVLSEVGAVSGNGSVIIHNVGVALGGNPTNNQLLEIQHDVHSATPAAPAHNGKSTELVQHEPGSLHSRTSFVKAA